MESLDALRLRTRAVRLRARRELSRTRRFDRGGGVLLGGAAALALRALLRGPRARLSRARARCFPVRPIAVSPLAVGRFFSARGAEVLASELRWLGLSALALWLVSRLAARGRADARSSSIASATHSAMMNLERAVP